MANSTRIIIEVASFTPNAAAAAYKAGADRIELCSGYAEGGLSPSAASILWVKENVPIPLHVMVRPRIGDFVYNETEKEIMLGDIQFCKEHQVDGIVAGALTTVGEVDAEFTKMMVEAAYPMSFTFHRAFDLCGDLPSALETLIQCGVQRVLTSGGEANCISGLKTIATLLEQVAGRIIILPGGGIKLENVNEIIKLKGINEIHLSGKQLVRSKMSKHSKVSFTSAGEVDDNNWYECDPEIIAALRKKLSFSFPEKSPSGKS
jgi:copper homeostasis protein